MNRCKKCGQILINPRIKDIKRVCLDGYEPDLQKCNGCNATDSIILRLSKNGSITLEDLKILPSFLVFDPQNDNDIEHSYGVKFNNIVKEIENCHNNISER